MSLRISARRSAGRWWPVSCIGCSTERPWRPEPPSAPCWPHSATNCFETACDTPRPRPPTWTTRCAANQGCRAASRAANRAEVKEVRTMIRRVLLLCTGNSCRSQMAEAYLRRLGGEDYEVYSARTHPADEVHPLAIEVMREAGIDISGQWPKHV